MAYQHITIEEINDFINDNKKFMLLDVRSEEEVEEIRIPGSSCIPLPVLSVDKMKDLMTKKGFSMDDPIYVTCLVGPRAVTACEMLQEDFKEVYHVVGCLNSWIEEGYRTESGGA